MENNWIKIKDQEPPQNVLVATKIHDEKGERNNQPMTLKGRLWWIKEMYVYYEPTHWMPLNKQP